MTSSIVSAPRATHVAPAKVLTHPTRLDIQGLRAFAVLVVVANHLTEWPRGGFAGVDIFFVISGFLITSQLVRTHERTGHISFVDFYRRRVRRIIPAAVACLTVTVVVSRLVFLGDRWRSSVTDAVWAFLFSANWRFQKQSTDYFARGGPQSPFQHYWSLSIEEQFYFVWPWLLLLTLSLLLRRQTLRTHRVATFSLITGLSVVSLIWAFVQTSSNPTGAYFSTFTRAWELGMGAILASAVPQLRRMPNRFRPLLAWVGVGGMVATLWVISSSSPVPAPAMLLPVASAGLFIAAGTREGQQPYLWLFTNSVSNYIGDISYSLYLWHFPVIVVLQAAIGGTGAVFYLAAIAGAGVFSVASYHLIEQPARTSPWLLGRESSSSAWRNWRSEHAQIYKNSGVAGLFAVTVLACGLALHPKTPPTEAKALDFSASTSTDTSSSGILPPQGSDTVGAASSGASQATGTTGSTDYFSAQEKQLTEAVDQALSAKAWPDNLDPSLGSVESAGLPDEQQDGCGDTVVDDPASCAFGDPSKPHMVVLGDSTGITLLPTVRAAYGDEYYIRGLTKADCVVPVAKVPQVTGCVQHTADSIAWIKNDKPDVVFVISTYAMGIQDGIHNGPTFQTAWQNGTQALVNQLAPVAKTVVLVSPPPAGQAVSDCATKTSTPADCIDSVPSSWHDGQNGQLAVTGTNVHYYDTLNWFCSADDKCPPFVGSTITQRDPLHTTKQWAAEVGPLFKARVHQWLPKT